MHQLDPQPKPAEGRGKSHRRPRQGKMRYTAIVVAASLAGAGFAAVGFLAVGHGHGRETGAASRSASTASSVPQPVVASGMAATASGGDRQPTLAAVPSSAMPTVSVTHPSDSTAAHSTAPASVPSSLVSPTTRQPSPPPVTHSPTDGNGVITTGDSKAHCISANLNGGVLTAASLAQIANATGMTFNCISGFASPSATWGVWETPWMFSTPSENWDSWLKNPAHQAVMSLDLIPQTLANNDNPLTWEQACAAGDYDKHATTLAKNLVSYGAGGIAIRLGPEANGDWEPDYVGTTGAEMSAWGQCFDHEVAAMRAVSGAHFLFIWNPNVCTANLPSSQWYPGNSYVDIIGIDAYDLDCETLKTVGEEGWAAYSADSAARGSKNPDFPSLVNFESFAAAHGKPLSLPEWGLGAGDDPAYVTSLMQMFKNDDFAFECYFDTGSGGIAQLGPAIPDATAAYAKAFS